MKNKIYYLVVSLLITALMNCSQSSENAIPGERIREYANSLYNRELYSQAVEQYKEYLTHYNPDPKIQANVSYTIADIYFERLRDYSEAMAYYMKIKHVFPESELIDNANKRIVECLERLDRSVDATQALKESVSLDPDQVPENRPGEVIAEFSDRKFTMGDLEYEIERTTGNKNPTKDEKVTFLRSYIQRELLYNTAKREGLENTSEVTSALYEAKKDIMASIALQNELKDKLKIDEKDLKLHYEEHKEDFTEKDEEGNVKQQKSFDEAREEIIAKVSKEKQQEIAQDMFDRLVEAENAKIYLDKIK